MKGVGCNLKGNGKKKGRLKVCMLNDSYTDTSVFTKISQAKIYGKRFLLYLNSSKGSMLVFEKAYNYYRQFAELKE